MIVKMFKRSGSPQNAVDYLLLDKENKNQPRQNCQILAGNKAIFLLTAESLPFKQQYTSGVISFNVLHDKETLYKVIDYYDKFFKPHGIHSPELLWVLHEDKGRSELHFLIPNVNMESFKAFSPFVAKRDVRALNALKETIIQDLGLENERVIRKNLIENDNKRLNFKPKDSDIRKLIEEAFQSEIFRQIENGRVLKRQEVLKILENVLNQLNESNNSDFSLHVRGKQTISINSSDLKRSIRLKGFIFDENQLIDKDIMKRLNEAPERYEDTRRTYNGKKKSDLEHKTNESHEAEFSKKSKTKTSAKVKAGETVTKDVYFKDKHLGKLEISATKIVAKDFRTAKALAFNVVQELKNQNWSSAYVRVSDESRKSEIFREMLKNRIEIKNSSESDLKLIEKIKSELKPEPKNVDKSISDIKEAKKPSKRAKNYKKQQENDNSDRVNESFKQKRDIKQEDNRQQKKVQFKKHVNFDKMLSQNQEPIEINNKPKG